MIYTNAMDATRPSDRQPRRYLADDDREIKWPPPKDSERGGTVVMPEGPHEECNAGKHWASSLASKKVCWTRPVLPTSEFSSLSRLVAESVSFSRVRGC